MTNLIQGYGGGGKGGGGGGSATEAADSLKSIQYARTLYAVGEGEIVGLVNGAQSIYLDDTPLQNANGTYNFKNVSVASRVGTQGQTQISGFSTVESETPVGLQVLAATPITKTILTSNIDRARVTLSIPRLTTQSTTTGDLTGGKVEYKISVQSNGGGYVDQLLGSTTYPSTISAGIAYTGTGATDFTGSATVTSNTATIISAVVEIQYRITAGSWVVLSSNTISVPVFKRVVRAATDRFNARWVIAPGTASISFTKPSLAANTYEIRAVVISGSCTAAITTCSATYATSTISVVGKAANKYQISHEILLTGSSPWDIKVTRLTADAVTSNVQNQTWWDSYTAIVDDKLSYPNTALVGLQIDASQFKQIPNAGFLMKMLKVKIPSNYNPRTRVYTGIWDGTFLVDWTDNPAWCFYDLITNARYGLGEYIPESWVNAAELYTIGQYCDELVSDGFGGTEPRFTCNLYLQSQEDAYKVIDSMASIFRAMSYWYGGAVTPVCDKPESVWVQFNNSDVIDGFFDYQGSANKARHSTALIQWNDSLNRYKQTPEYVEDFDGITRYGVNQLDISAYGCTSRGQAHRIGKWALLSERLETEIVSFKTALKAIALTPGKIINIYDRYRAGIRYGGRILSATTTSITVDAAITISSGITYSVDLEMPDGSLQTRTLTNVVGSATVLTWVTALSVAPNVYAVWGVTSDNVAPQSFRCLSVVEESKGLYTITALTHNSSKYNFVENNISLTFPPVSIRTLSESVDAPTQVSSFDTLFMLAPNVVGTKLTVSWEPVVGA